MIKKVYYKKYADNLVFEGTEISGFQHHHLRGVMLATLWLLTHFNIKESKDINITYCYLKVTEVKSFRF